MEQQRIVCAANRHPDGRIALGVRHFCQQMCANIQAYPDHETCDWRKSEQGFIDNHWNFLSREAAWDVAEAAGQIINDRDWFPGSLHSEHLY
jgi:hypothetical protein